MVNVLAGIAGFASGGMSIALGRRSASSTWNWRRLPALSPQILHRVAALAWGALVRCRTTAR